MGRLRKECTQGKQGDANSNVKQESQRNECQPKSTNYSQVKRLESLVEQSLHRTRCYITMALDLSH